MAAEAGEARRAGEWGPVRRGFRVSLPGGQRGWVEDIRLGDDGVELLVAAELSARHRLWISAAEVEAILPEARLILVADPKPWAVPADGVGDVEAVGEVVHMPVRRSPRIGAPQRRRLGREQQRQPDAENES